MPTKVLTPRQSQKKKLKYLRRLALSLWRRSCLERDGKRCVLCGTTEKINVHHIEDYRLNRRLRHDPENGICLCPTHHKFGRDSFHHSFVIPFIYLFTNRRSQVDYILANRDGQLQFEDEEAQLYYEIKLLGGDKDYDYSNGYHKRRKKRKSKSDDRDGGQWLCDRPSEFGAGVSDDTVSGEEPEEDAGSSEGFLSS